MPQVECILGEIRMFAGVRLPSGWAYCQGQLISIVDFQPLYSVIGTTYGGDGRATFGLPDLRGRVPLHMGQGVGLAPRSIGQSGGTNTVTLTMAEMPTHNHLMSASSRDANQTTPKGGLYAAIPMNGHTFYADEATAGTPPQVLLPDTISVEGRSLPHENRMPIMGMNFIIALNGIYPTFQ